MAFSFLKLITVFVTCKAETPSPSVASLESVSLNNRASSRSTERLGQCRVEKNIKIMRYLLLWCIDDNGTTAIVLRGGKVEIVVLKTRFVCVFKGRVNQNGAAVYYS